MAEFRMVRAVMRDDVDPLPWSAWSAARVDEFWDQRARRDELAQERMWTLLLSLLRDDERQRYADDGNLIVTGSDGGRYRIDLGFQGNVYRLDGNDYALTCYCAHPRMILGYAEMLPIEGAMIAQILAIRADEAAFLRIANVM